MEIERKLREHNLVSKAINLAAEAHKHQKRKVDGSPYIHHPIQVGLILAREGFANRVVAAGILHDVIEDTEITYQNIVDEVGEEIANLVRDVTEPPKSISWEERKKTYREHLKSAPVEAVAISLADRLDNRITLLSAYKTEGEIVFTRLRRGLHKLLDSDRRLIEIYKTRLPESRMLKELEIYMSELEKVAENVKGSA